MWGSGGVSAGLGVGVGERLLWDVVWCRGRMLDWLPYTISSGVFAFWVG